MNVEQEQSYQAKLLKTSTKKRNILILTEQLHVNLCYMPIYLFFSTTTIIINCINK